MRKLYVILLVLCFGCNRAKPVLVTTELVNSKGTLKITGPDSTILNDIVRGDSTLLQVLFPVYSMPIDTDMKSYIDARPGKYVLKKGEVFFTPDTPFKKKQAYFLRYYDYALSGDIWEFIKNNNHKRKPPYTDHIFTP